MSRFKTLVKESFVYGFASIVSRFIGFLLMPLYTRILTPEDYGVLNVINITIMLVTLFAVLGLDGAAHIFYWDDNKNKKSIFSSWFWSQFLISVILGVLMLTIADKLSVGLFKSNIHANKFRLSSLILITGILPSILINWFRVRRMPWPTTWFSLTMSLITIGLNIWFIALLKWGVNGFILAQIISGGLMSFVAVYFMNDWLSPMQISRKLLKRMLNYSFPMIPTPLAFWSLNFAGSYFLQVIKGETEVGLFQTGATIASIMMLVISSFTQAWGPFAMSIKDEEGSNIFYSRVLILYISVAGIFAATISVFAPEILYVMTTPGYWDAHYVTSILAFNAILTGLNFIGALGLNFVKNMKPYSLAIIAGALFNLFLYSFIIKLFGKEGCALLTLISNIGVTFWIFRSAQKFYFIPYNFSKCLYVFSICVIAAIAGKFIVIDKFLVSILVKFLLIFFLFGVLIVYNKNTIMQSILKYKILKR